MCCSGFLKIMMFIFNGGIFLAGAAILGVGIWLKVDSNSLFGILDQVEGTPSNLSQLVYVAYLLIGLGAVLLIIGFLGCCGAVRESRCMLLTFFCIVLIIFLAEVAGAVVLLVFRNVADDLLASMEKDLTSGIEENYGKKDDWTSLWNTTMEGFKCCGFNNYTDFDGSPFNTGTGLYPTMCCNGNADNECNEKTAEMSDVKGCYQTLIDWIENNSAIVAGVALGIVAIEIAAMVVSMVLYKSIGTKA